MSSYSLRTCLSLTPWVFCGKPDGRTSEHFARLHFYNLMMQNCVNGVDFSGLYATSSSLSQSSSGSVLVILGVLVGVWVVTDRVHFETLPSLCFRFVFLFFFLFSTCCCCSLTLLWALSLYHVTICYCAPLLYIVASHVSRLTSLLV